MLRAPLEPGVRVRKEFINQNETRVLSALPTTYICFTISILHYVIYSCLPFTTTSPPHVSLLSTTSLLCHKNEDEPLQLLDQANAPGLSVKNRTVFDHHFYR